MSDLSGIQGKGVPGRGRSFAVALILTSSIIISFGGLVVRNLDVSDPWLINIYRSGALGGVVLVSLLFRFRSKTVSTFLQVGIPGVVASIMIALAGLSYLQALMNTTIANTLFTLGAIPFFTAFIAWLVLGEKLNFMTLITMFFACLGIVVMVKDGMDGGTLFGNLMALVTAFSFAIYAVIVRKYRHINMQPVLIISSALICVICTWKLSGNISMETRDIVLCFIWGGILSGIGNMFFLVAAKYLPAAEITLYMLVEFALGPFWVWLFMGESLSVATLVGGVMVLISVLVRSGFEITSRRSIR